jgi:hypothetical protein
MWCLRRVEDISWSGCAGNRVKRASSMLRAIESWQILRRKCLLKHVIGGKIEGRPEMRGRRGRRHKQLLDDLKGKIGCWKLKEEALDGTLWRTRFGRGYGPVLRQTAA